MLGQNEDWQYLPLVTKHPFAQMLRICLTAFQLPEALPHTDVPMKHHRYFTDGACINPTFSDARISSWAVIRDMTCSDEHALTMM